MLHTDKNVESFQQDSEAVKTSIGSTAKVSFWFTLKKVLVKHYQKMINSTIPLNKTTLKAESLSEEKLAETYFGAFVDFRRRVNLAFL